jgi:predicted ATPase/class 3 adenylate cyclase
VLPSGTVTFVFTDIESSTTILRDIGPDRYERLLEEHTALLHATFRPHGGYEVRSEGDSFFFVFALARSAIAAAVDAQRAFAAHEWPSDARVRIRIGMHSGEGRPGTPATGMDYVGVDVHRAARIAAAGSGGQILLSEPTRALVAEDLPKEVSIRELGEYLFKGMSHGERVSLVEAPFLETAFSSLRAGQRMGADLPPQRTSFVSRGPELAGAAQMVEKTRLVTLTGPGGSGKTRLALELARRSADRFPDGVHFVPLASVTSTDHVPRAIAQSLALPLRPHDMPIDVLRVHIGTRRVLLVLDNLEHLLGASAHVSHLLDVCAELRIVVTSRAPLQLAGEQTLPIAPLDVPGEDRSVDALARCASVQLFVERAMAVDPAFRLGPENAAAVARICELLDGLPLAIELAAARMDILGPGTIAERIERHLPLPGSGPRDLPDRQRTLDAAIDWSYALLDAASRRVFASFAVFSGGARLEETERVCADGDVVERLATLARQSLLRQQELEGSSRFFMLATIRDFALARLASLPDRDEVARRHAEAYIGLFEVGSKGLIGHDQEAWDARLDREHQNLRAALTWAAGADPEIGLRLVAASWRYWLRRGGLAEGRRYAEEALGRAGGADPTVRMRALEALAGLVYWQGDLAARPIYEERLELARGVGDPRSVAQATYDLAYTALSVEGDAPRAVDLFQQARSAFEGLGDELGAARADSGLSSALNETGDLDAAIAAADRALAVMRRHTDLYGLAVALSTMARVSLRRGELAQTGSLLLEVIPLQSASRGRTGIVIDLVIAAMLAYVRGELERAHRLAGKVAAMRSLAGTRSVTGFMSVLADRDLAKAGWDPEVFARPPADPIARRAWEDGRAMTLDAAIAEATGVARDAAATSDAPRDPASA